MLSRRSLIFVLNVIFGWVILCLTFMFALYSYTEDKFFDVLPAIKVAIIAFVILFLLPFCYGFKLSDMKYITHTTFMENKELSDVLVDLWDIDNYIKLKQQQCSDIQLKCIKFRIYNIYVDNYARDKKNYQLFITEIQKRYSEYAYEPNITSYSAPPTNEVNVEETVAVVQENKHDEVKKLIRESNTSQDAMKKLHYYWYGKHKSNEEIGRDYERYVGWTYEDAGYKVQYVGIEQGKEDGGIDLVCTKDNTIELVQCKYWAREKMIFEKHLNQLFGATRNYIIESNLQESQVKSVFITNISLSDSAKRVASNLGIEVNEGVELDKAYPCIKCNISSNSNKIYHMPFDGQYDRTKIMKKGECYVRTIEEAERLGFRRTN